MNLKGYLKTRGVLANALFKKEAAMLNLPWPLPKGWVSVYGDIEISKEAEDRLRNFLNNKGRSQQDIFHQSNQTARTELPESSFAHKAAHLLAKNIQVELEAMIRAELMKNAEKIVEEVAKSLAASVKSNLSG